tara:strand:- start:34 stop:222 length:189 start_codon:yes stop_codon:yes gene_type:complete
MRQTANNSNKFELTNKKKATRTERLDKKSIRGMTVAGITSKLDTIYINLLSFSQENILLILI